MNVLGLSCDFHDASAALVQNGQLIAASNEERFTWNKHDQNFPQFAIQFCLESAKIQPDELDLVVFYENPIKKWLRILDSNLANWPNTRSEFIYGQREWLGKKLWLQSQLAKQFPISLDQIILSEHHTSHAYQAFVGSGLDRAAILTVDAVGENATTSWAQASWQGEKPVITPIRSASYPNSLGLFYSAMTAFLGFQPMNDECSVMALAAFGQSKYMEEFSQFIHTDQLGFPLIDPTYLNFDNYLSEPFTPKFIELLGRPRASHPRLQFSSLCQQPVDETQQHYADIAATTQRVFTDAVVKLSTTLKNHTNEQNLCYAGGAALNCVANSEIVKNSGFENVSIPIDPGDGGASIGAAYFGYYQSCDTPQRAKTYSCYLGSQQKENLPHFLDALDIPHTEEYQKLGLTPDKRTWTWEEFEDKQSQAECIAQALLAGKVVALYQNRSELGPRALGNRSLLFRADDILLAQKVSQKIKERAPFRPYALAILEEDAPILLDADLSGSATAWHRMQLSAKVHEKMQPLVRAGIHSDGTTRPQIVCEEDNPFFYKVLKSYKKYSGGPGVLINTSLNESGYPLVDHPLGALHMFARTPIDVCTIDQYMISREDKK